MWLLDHDKKLTETCYLDSEKMTAITQLDEKEKRWVCIIQPKEKDKTVKVLGITEEFETALKWLKTFTP